MPLCDCIKDGDPPLLLFGGEILPDVELGIITGEDPFKMPEQTSPAEIEFPLQFRDLFPMSYPLYWRVFSRPVPSLELKPEDLRLLLPSKGSLRLSSSKVLPKTKIKQKLV